jgi:polyisoprenoid-binding protein YceI
LISNTRGRFTGYDVTIVTGEDPLRSSVTATIDLATVDTRLKMRDDHLRSPDYLDVEKYPTMTYRSTGIRLADDGDWVIDGELTVHGVTRQVPLALEVYGFGTDPWGGQRAGFSATARISRRDFGIGYRDGADVGGAAVADTVSVSLDIEAVRQR